MQPTPALIISQNDLEAMLIKAGKTAAQEILNARQEELNQDPKVLRLKRLRDYINDRSTLSNPRDHWASGKDIRAIELSRKGKPRCLSWFRTFKVESTLIDCPHCKSTEHASLMEWCFEDIANAWDYYHRQRWLRV